VDVQAPAADPATALVGFARAVGRAGVEISPDRTRTFLAACAELGAADLGNVYWAGRAALAPQPDQLGAYEAVFSLWFSGSLVPAPRRRAETADRVGAAPGVERDAQPDAGSEDDQLVPAVSSELDRLRARDLASLSPAELAAVVRLFAAVRPRPPRRRGHRWRPANTGVLDVRRTLRADLRRGGEPGRLLRRRRATRPRRVVLLLDVSGSMAPYADALLRLAHVWVRSAPATTEVFTMGTRLTRVTVPLRSPDPAAALLAAGGQVPDWSGGTRLGEVVRAFVDGWGRRGSARGAVVVVLSDGWERGDAVLLGEQVARLRRLAHRVVWVSPHRDRQGYRPVQAGIRAALPHCDAFLAGHSLAAFAELARVVADA
jgi:uncharacterized protein with von Willebrand factor type A (vWA) domain